MTDLCDELLNSDTSTDTLTGAIMAFAKTVLRRTKTATARIPSEKVIGCLRTTNRRLPDLHQVSVALARCLYHRFDITASEDDYNEGMAILDELISFRGPGDTPSPEWGRALSYARDFSHTRFETSGKPEYLEQAIDFNRTWLDELSLEDPNRDFAINALLILQNSRFDGSGVTIDWETRLRGSSESGKFPSFRDLTTSLPELSIEPLPMTSYNIHFSALLFSTIYRLTDIGDIEDGVNYIRKM